MSEDLSVTLTLNDTAFRRAMDAARERARSAFYRMVDDSSAAMRSMNERFMALQKQSPVSFEGMAKTGFIAASAMNAANVALKVYRGGWDEAYKAIERLPMGIGQVARAEKELIYGLMGWDKELEAIARRSEQITREFAAQTKSVTEMRDVLAAIGRMGFEPRTELQKLYESYNKGLDVAANAPTPLDTTALTEALSAAEMRIRTREDRKLREELEERKRKEKQAAHDLFVEQRNDLLELGRVESDLRQKALRWQGRETEAEREGIRQQFREQIMTAREGDKMDLVRRLELMRDLELATIGERGGGYTQAEGISTRHVDPGGLALTGQRDQKLEDLRRLSEAQLNELRRLVAAMTSDN